MHKVYAFELNVTSPLLCKHKKFDLFHERGKWNALTLYYVIPYKCDIQYVEDKKKVLKNSSRVAVLLDNEE